MRDDVGPGVVGQAEHGVQEALGRQVVDERRGSPADRAAPWCLAARAPTPPARLGAGDSPRASASMASRIFT